MSRYKSRREFLSRMGLGCASVGATTLLSGITNMGLLNAAAISNKSWVTDPCDTDNENYQALVCIMLAGGNDSYNMLVPRKVSTYNEYASVRTNLAIHPDDLLPLVYTNAFDQSFGLHPNLPKTKNLFDAGHLAFICNVGTLVEPTTVAAYNNLTNLPLGLFSHSDQQKHWQTSIPQDRNALGWGGKLADLLHEGNGNTDISMNISLNGFNLFQSGNSIQPYTINPTANGSVLLNGSNDNGNYEMFKRNTVDDILTQMYTNALEKAYANSIIGSKSNSIAFDSAINNYGVISTQFENDKLSQRLKMVARTIKARNVLDVNKQTFFVQLGGFDTHDNIIDEHAILMNHLDDALYSFYEAMDELCLLDKVTVFTISDFARKLVSNGDGSDHGWGGHSIVMGGSVSGGKVYGRYPDLYLGNPLDIGEGRIIPSISCDEYFAELALWFGVQPHQLIDIFPNINNFYSPISNDNPIGFLNQ